MTEKRIRRAQRQSLAEASFVAVANEDLPALTGSEKQIAWANRIRERMVARASSVCYRPYSEYARAEAERHLAARALLNAMMDHSSASWWIEHQDDLRSLDADYQRRLAELQSDATL